MPNCLSFGYQGHEPSALVSLLPTNAVICDIRLIPNSRNPAWSKKRLSELLGERYVWLRGLGNDNYKNGGAVKLHDPEDALPVIKSLIAAGKTPVLMCVCKDFHACHRRHVAELINQKLHIRTSELITDPATKAAPARATLPRSQQGDLFRPEAK